MTITFSPSTTSVSTVCCVLLTSVLVPWALARMRWTAAMTSSGCARKALPSSVVHWMFSDRRTIKSGTATRPWMLGSQVCFFTASASAWSFKSLFLASHCWSWMISKRIGGGHQGLAEQGIGIERDRRDQGIQLIVWKPPCLLRSGVRGGGGVPGRSVRNPGRVMPPIGWRARRAMADRGNWT